MLISIIIPCFKASATVPRAVASISKQALPNANVDVEIILAADDGEPYGDLFHDHQKVFAHLPDKKFQIRIVEPIKGRHGSGPGATRNRGIAAAKGNIIGFLDADDEWAPNYLAEMIPLVRQNGAAFAPTTIFNNAGRQIITLGAGQRRLSVTDFGVWPGSFHPMLDRRLTPGFRDGAGQDVFHAIDVLGLIGGTAALASQTAYCLHLKEGSVTADPSFSRKIDSRYRAMIRHHQSPDTVLYGMDRLKAIQAIHRRMMWNAAWLDAGHSDDGFYGFVAEKIRI